MSGVSRAKLCRHYTRSTLATQREHHSGVPVHLVPTSSVGAVGAGAVAVIAALCRQAALPSDLLRDNELLVHERAQGLTTVNFTITTLCVQLAFMTCPKDN